MVVAMVLITHFLNSANRLDILNFLTYGYIFNMVMEHPNTNIDFTG
jgi:hypothetical protein